MLRLTLSQTVLYRLVCCHRQLRVLLISDSIMCDLAVSSRLHKIAHPSAGVPDCAHTPKRTQVHETHTSSYREKHWLLGSTGNPTRKWKCHFSPVYVLPTLDITCDVQAPPTLLNTRFLALLHFLPEFRASSESRDCKPPIQYSLTRLCSKASQA